MPLAGLQVESRPKAAVQRRMYAHGEIAEAEPAASAAQALGPGAVPSTPRTASSASSAPEARNSSSTNRIDPSQIPRPESLRAAERWQTRANVGQSPPAATSAFVVEDDGNCSPRYMRLTINQVLSTADALTSSAVPFGVVCQPLADVPLAEGKIPVIDFGEAGPVRCERCRAYVNPFFTFLDGGRSFQCNLCGMVNSTPRDYFCEIDHNGNRRDQNERPELCHGVVEFVAPAEYQARPPLPPPIVFLVECSFGAVSGGIFQAVIASLRALLPGMPPESRIALITFDDSLHFFHTSADSSLKQMSVTDLSEPCLPLPASLLLHTLGETLDRIEELLQALPTFFAHSKRPDAALGAALQASTLLLEQTGGRLLIFQHTLPTVGPLKLQQRDDVRQYGTDKEKALLSPLDASWEALAKKMSSCQICASSFHFIAGNFVDVASQERLCPTRSSLLERFFQVSTTQLTTPDKTSQPIMPQAERTLSVSVALVPQAVLVRQTGGQLYLYQNCVPDQVRTSIPCRLHP